MKISEIIDAVTLRSPLSLQESWDNSGVQVGATDGECTGVLLCVDCSPVAVAEAVEKGCNLIISHHPLIFKGLKHIVPGESKVQQAVIDAIRGGVTVFALHTPVDSSRDGISWTMARMLGAAPVRPLAPGSDSENGLGMVAEYPTAISETDFVAKIKSAFGSPVVRCSALSSKRISRIGLCGGSGGEFIPTAIAAGCDAYLSSDIRYHDFVDYGNDIFLTDIGHFESEQCSKEIFYRQISEIFPNFAVYKSETERNSINYL